jgi:hypothetical protein
MSFARDVVVSAVSGPPAGESLMTRILVIGFDARRFDNMSSATIR